MMDRRALLAALLAAAPTAALAQSPLSRPAPGFAQSPTPADLMGVTGEPYFAAWLNDFYGRAQAAGLSRAVLDRELSGLSPDPRVAALDARQPEFAKPVSDYIHGAVSEARVALGRAKRDAVPEFGSIEQAYGVPRDVLVAVWAMESDFGALQGNFDVVRSLATLAAAGRRRPWAEGELIAALRILQSGAVPRSRLKGSWAGAMGQTQLIPSTYLSAAVDADGDGRRDIWGSPADALASAADLLAKGGWRRSEGWAREVILPPGFDWGLSEGPKQPPSWWQARGARRADGRTWSGAEADEPVTLLLPAGMAGPAFLLLPNHFAIRTYNNSISYALGIGILADRFAGGGPLATPWPRETPLSLTDRLDAQNALIKLGFNPGQPDGAVGVATRAALRAWQKSAGLPADGYLSPDMVGRLRAAVRGRA